MYEVCTVCYTGKTICGTPVPVRQFLDSDFQQAMMYIFPISAHIILLLQCIGLLSDHKLTECIMNITLFQVVKQQTFQVFANSQGMCGTVGEKLWQTYIHHARNLCKTFSGDIITSYAANIFPCNNLNVF